MREILFRGKRLDNGEWVEGYYVHQYGAHEIYGADTADFERVHIEPATVGQYTGLTDKNGKRIFEGDICNGVFNARFVVYFDADYLQFRARIQENFCHELDYYGVNKIEIIGNIHDNPELAEGRQWLNQ